LGIFVSALAEKVLESMIKEGSKFGVEFKVAAFTKWCKTIANQLRKSSEYERLKEKFKFDVLGPFAPVQLYEHYVTVAASAGPTAEAVGEQRRDAYPTGFRFG